MIRLVLFFVLLGLIAWGGVYLVEHPGHVSMNWFGWQIETSAALMVIAVAVVAIVAWIVFRIVVGLPGFVSYSARRRRREKGYEALSRGLVAVHAGDARGAGRASAQASRKLADDPLALMLRAQSAQLSGDPHGAIQAYEQLARREDTRLLGLRGLHAEADRRGDIEAAHHFASAAHRVQALPWTAQAQLEHHAARGDWEGTLRTIEAGVAARHIDREQADRKRAVLETAIAQEKELTAPEEALALARAAMKRAPDLAPPIVLAARVLSRRGEIRKASKLIEKAWPRCPHPDLAQAYMDVRPGDSTADRLTRARTLMGITTYDPTARLTVAGAALAATDYESARAAMEPLAGEGKRPTVRMCLLMAELEEAEHGDDGLWREWLARASRAALDPAWMADGIVYDEWAPASPTTGQLDAFRWQVPAERPGPVMDALPPRPEPRLAAAERPALAGAAAARLDAPEAELVEPDAATVRVAPSAAERAQAKPAEIVPAPRSEVDEAVGVPAPVRETTSEPSLYDRHAPIALVTPAPPDGAADSAVDHAIEDEASPPEPSRRATARTYYSG